MVAFGKRMMAQRYGPWESKYLDYRRLKGMLSRKTEEEDKAAAGSSIAAFKTVLDLEIEKVVLFFLEIQGQISESLFELREELLAIQKEIGITTAGTSLDNENHRQTLIQSLAHRVRVIGDQLLHLVYYVELNVIGLRKILKKHDKKRKDHRITQSYLKSRIQDAQGQEHDSHLRQLYNYEGISAIVASLDSCLVLLGQLERHVMDNMNDHSPNDSPSSREPVLLKISAARRRLDHSSSYVRAFAAQSLIFDSPEDDQPPSLLTETTTMKNGQYESLSSRSSQLYASAQLRRRREERQWSTQLNLISTFLYMMNYYIVSPTSGKYAQDLGSSAALSGLIIGLTPAAALVSAVGYSYWANFGYREPLLFASGCCWLGNALYVLAWPFDSMTLVLVGRLVNGLGAARAINRRYIADSFTFEERTAASAKFVTAGALGMASGPAVAALLSCAHLDPDNATFLTDETFPSYCMLALWTLYGIVAFLKFIEPPRDGGGLADDPPSRREAEGESLLPVVKWTTAPTETRSPISLSSVVVEAPQVPSPPATAPASSLPPPPPPLSSILTRTPVMVTLVLYFVLKLVLECLLTSSAPLTQFYFGWSSLQVGSFLATLGLLMFPANLALGYLVCHYDDRELLATSLLGTALGLVLMLNLSGRGYSSVQYMTSALVVFISTNVLEGVNMSLLSKTMPKALARGTFNSGLLATEAGTLGRAVGDQMVTAVGYFLGMDYVLNGCFIPLAVIVFAAMAVVWMTFDVLDDEEEEEDMLIMK